MILTFLLGAAAGFAAPHVSPHLRAAVERGARDAVDIGESEAGLLTLALLLLLVALVTGGGASVALLLGAVVGVAAMPAIAAIQGRDAE